MSAKNAVDEDPDTYALTKSETNPQLTVTLADIFDIGHIYINLTIGTVYSVIFAPLCKLSKNVFYWSYKKYTDRQFR